MTRSAFRPFSRQYSCASSAWRTTPSSSSTTRTSRIGRSPEMPCGHKLFWPSSLAASTSAGARSDPSVPSTRDASRSNSTASSFEMSMCRRRLCAVRRARARACATPCWSRDRSAPGPWRFRDRARRRWRSRGAPIRRPAARTRWRRLRIGSSTKPVAPDSGRPSSAIGFSSVRPRPMKRARSVSHSSGPCGRPSRLRTCTAHVPGSRESRGRRWQISAPRSARNSVSMNSLPNAGCAKSSRACASATST